MNGRESKNNKNDIRTTRMRRQPMQFTEGFAERQRFHTAAGGT